MQLKSPVFDESDQIPGRCGKARENVSPPLIFENVPQNAESLVLVMDDPDSKKVSGKVWDHWLVWNIDPTTVEFPEGQVPSGIEGLNDFDEVGWGGPNPPDDTHEYRFILYAVDTVLDLPRESKKKDVYDAIKGHVIEKDELHGVYSPVG
ncbi:MAG: YbhB/YbcL family Raf kinase inhibitor-like protein [Candidatus Nanohalobium sp.]